MPKEKVLITFIGVHQAKKGFTFIHEGLLKNCEECDFFKVCMKNLEPGRIYKVKKILQKKFPCKVHENGVQVVEVTESDIEASIQERQAFNGCIITFQHQDCNEIHCSHYEKCKATGLKNGDKCRIIKVKEKLTCPLEKTLVSSVLHRLPSDESF